MSKSSFDMLKVNIWLSGTVDDQGNGGWSAIIHTCIGGQNYEKKIGGYAKKTTVTRLNLIALLTALREIKKPSMIHVYTSVPQISSGINKNMNNWAKAGWLTASGKPPKHQDLWEQVHSFFSERENHMGYKIHSIQRKHDLTPYYAKAIESASRYIMISKTDLYEVSLA